MKTQNHIIEGQFGKDISLDITYPEQHTKSPVIVFLHGFKGFKDWGAWHLVANYFAAKGYAFVKFNYSHNGVDHQNPDDLTDLDAFSENNFFMELSDTTQVMDWLETLDNIDAGNITLIGHSRAGGIALITASEQARVKKVATWAAVSDYHRYIGAWDVAKWQELGSLPFVNSRTKQIFNINYQFYEVLKANEDFFDLQKVCSALKKPVLIIHAKDDPAVDSNQAEELFDWCIHSELMLLESGGHTFDTHHPYMQDQLPQNMIEVCERMLEFLVVKE